MRNPDVYKAREFKEFYGYVEKDGCWIPARPIPFYGLRLFHNLKLAWFVFIGKYDCVDFED